MLERQLAARELGGGTFAPLQNEKLSHGLTRSLSGRRLKGREREFWAREKREGAREEGEKETAFLSLPPCSPRPSRFSRTENFLSLPFQTPATQIS